MYKKGLALAIILLFISVSFQPVFAINNKSSTGNTEIENDCGCETISVAQNIRFEKLLNKLEIHLKKLSLLFKNNPKILEKYKELSKRITTLEEMNYSFFLDEYSNICSFLEAIFNPLNEIFDYIDGLRDWDENLSPLLRLIRIAITPLPILLLIIMYMGVLFECEFFGYVPK